MTFYKATRTDGTDFHTGTIHYDVGTTVRHPSPGAPGSYAAAGYLSVSVTPTDCTGMSWPSRLFEVEPVDPWTPNCSDLPSKRACHALRVVREVPAHLALGPQGEHVAALIERARSLTGDELQRLAAAWDAARDAARDAAGEAARDAARDAARVAARDAAGDAVSAAVSAAVLALTVRDLITPEHYAALTGPWASVIGKAHPDD